MDTPHLQKLLTTQGRFYRRAAGQVVQSFEDRSGFSYVAKGYVKRYLISNQGNLGVQSIYGPGYFFPLTAAFAAVLKQQIYQGDEQYYYEAMTATEIYVISDDTLREAAAAEPLIYKELLFEAGKRLQSNIQQLENVALKDPYRRVAHQLVFYAVRFGRHNGQGASVMIPLKQQDLADVLNLNRETVTRAISKLRAHGLIETENQFVIPDIEKLKATYR